VITVACGFVAALLSRFWEQERDGPEQQRFERQLLEFFIELTG
jgi:hypothetical protein